MNLRSVFLGEEKEENQSCFPSLSFNERMMGFGICFVVGSSAVTQGT